MKIAFLLSSAALLFSGCANKGAGLGSSQAATAAGAPRPLVNPSVVDRVDPPDRTHVENRGTVSLPSIIELPAAYRWSLVDGRPVLVRETDSRKITAGGTMQIVAGDVARGEIAIQPALLPQEIAAELTRNRALQTQMIAAFSEVNQQVASLIAETRTMQQRNAELMQQLARATERTQQLERQLQNGSAPETK